MSTAVITELATLPRVNLLPPEFAQRKRLRRLQAGIAAGVLASAGVVAALHIAALGQVDEARAELGTVQARQAELQSKVTELAHVPRVLAEVAAAEGRRGQALASEIRWSSYLHRIATDVPDNVWLRNVTVTQLTAGPVTPGTTTPEAPTAWAVPGVATISFEGRAYRYPDVSVWLETLAKQKGLTQPYLTTATEEESLSGPEDEPVLTFSSEVTVTEEALRRRYEPKAGS